ncbi:hypothetical protein AJ80_09980 [Polytolypa hystricis UAMH7299]|uniref:Protein kinase domain-containing protein n=1 Tax=Polytolypa hystricis (strain UAMH7299) TaxID=1447883 RepID=A0A2B7WFK6_POLH7|nr:hypothetical protein AJ80_09980 [Polytolypa hystricis UAMH7299]
MYAYVYFAKHARGDADFGWTDVEPNNILVDHHKTTTSISTPKLGDLGDTVRVQPTTNHIIGAPIFRAPEVFLGLPWSESVDIWSFGVTILDLLTGKHFFAPPNVPEDEELFDTQYDEIAGPVLEVVHALNQITDRDPSLQQKYKRTLSDSLHAEDLDFLLHFMHVDPRDRPSAAQLLEHPWFRDV